MFKKVVLFLTLFAALLTVGRFAFPYAQQLKDRLFPAYDFELIHMELSAKSVHQGEPITVEAIIKNTGHESRGTYYGVVKIFRSTNLEESVHSTHRDLPLEENCKLRVGDVVQGEASHFEYEWTVPEQLPMGVYYVLVEIWNPHLLYGGNYPKCFDRSAFGINFEVVPAVALD